jgi:outer membrane protein
MNSFFSRIAKIGLFQLLLIGPTENAGAEETTRTVRSDEVLRVTMAHNPAFKAAALSETRAEMSIVTSEGLYPFVFDADGGYTHSSSPLGSSLYSGRDEISLGAGISKTFSVGTTADFHLAGTWYALDTPASQTMVNGETDNSNFGLSARFTVTQPLLRGFGNRVGLSSLRQARKAKTIAEKTVDQTASLLAREVLNAYWDLWLSKRTLEINIRSRDVAKAQLAETELRVSSGDAAPVEKLSYQTRLASLEETVIESEAEVRRLQVALAAKAGTIDTHLHLLPDTEEPLPETTTPPPLSALLEQALETSPLVQRASVAVEAAEERLQVAGETMRQRLDLTGWIEARTFTEDQFSPVVTDFGEGRAYSGYIGVTYELPLDDRKRTGERAEARIDVQTAAEELRSAEQDIRRDLATAHNTRTTAEKRLAMAEETLALAQAQAEAEQSRYRLGAAIFTSVRDAEETVREAELRLTRAQVDIVKAQIELEHLTGALLPRVGRGL